jgi:hypothetical protein
MADKAEKKDRRERVAWELDRRRRLAVPGLAGGVLYMLGAVTTSSGLSGAPTVGLLQGISPAIHGVRNPSESPKVELLRYISNNSGALIAGALMTAIAILALMFVLLFLAEATKYRRPSMFSWIRLLILYGGIALAVAGLAHWIFYAVETHNFVASADHSVAASEAVLTGTSVQVVGSLAIFGGLFFAVGMVMLLINSLRVGLLPRWMAMLGMFAGLLIFLPIGGAQLQAVPALWMVFVGVLFLEKWPSGDPPAWKAGEAVPWPPGGRGAQQGGRPARGRRGAPAPEPAPEPQAVAVSQGGSSRKRRKRR